ACSGFGGVLSDIGAEAGSDGMVISGALAVIVSAVLLCVWGYKVRGVLQDYAASQFKVDFRLNALNAMILNVFYINYCINELPELVQRQKMIAGASESNN